MFGLRVIKCVLPDNQVPEQRHADRYRRAVNWCPGGDKRRVGENGTRVGRERDGMGWDESGTEWGGTEWDDIGHDKTERNGIEREGMVWKRKKGR